jgi:hypothetical protein
MLDRAQGTLDEAQRKALRVILQGQDAASFVEEAAQDVLHERTDVATLKRLMNLVLFKVHYDQVAVTDTTDNQRSNLDDAASVYRAG